MNDAKNEPSSAPSAAPPVSPVAASSAATPTASATASAGAPPPASAVAPSGAPPTAPPVSLPSKPAAAVPAVVLSHINAARVAQGIAELKLNEELCQAAQGHALDMTARGYFAYSPPGGGGGVEARIVAAGYHGRTGVNLSRGRDEAGELVEALLADANTKMSLLNKDYRELGAGESKAHWVLIFGTPTRLVTPELQQRARDLLNVHRVTAGLAAVELSPALNYAAQRHSLDMATRRFIGHSGSDNSLPAARVRDASYEGTAEELVVGDRDLETALTEWLADPAARPVLLLPGARQLGLGMAEGLLTLLCGVPATIAVNTSAELQARVLTLLNDNRQLIKAAPLSLNPALNAAAAAHSLDMADKDFFAFEQPGRLGIAGHLKQSGYRGRTLPAITMGQTTADAVVQLLLGHANHRRNLLDPENRDLGVGVTRSRWTLILGVPPAEVSTEVRSHLLTLLNAQRALSTAPPLQLSPLLGAVAQSYAEDMAKRSYFAFATPEGEALTTQAQRGGFTGRLIPALVKGYSSAEAALDTWMKSPQNRQNLLDPQMVHLGVGVADSRWVLLLGIGD